MTQLAVEVACLSDTELDIIEWDSDESGGINYNEFQTIMHEEGNNMSDQYGQIYFDMYDLDNDGEITVTEIWDLQSEFMDLHVYNSTNWLYATQYLMDSNNDTHIDHDEFKQGMNTILTILDQDKLEDDATVATFYELVFPPELQDSEWGPSAQETGLMVFMKDVIKAGIESYLADNNINQ